MKGRLSESPLAELAREIAEAGLSGALRLARERVKVVIYAQSGAISYARSNLRAHRLAETARRAAVVEEQKLSSLVTEMMSDAEAGAALVESRALTREGLTQLRTRQVLDVLRPPLLWLDGVWEFDPRARLAAEDLAVRFDATELLLEAARRLPPKFCAARFRDDGETISPAGAPPAHLQLNPVEGYVLSRLDAPARVSDLIMLCGLPESETLHAAYSLALGGFVRRTDWARALTDASGQPLPELSRATSAATAATGEAAAQGGAKDRTAEKAAEADPRREVEELISRAGVEDHYQALGVARSAPAPDIKRAYYALARRFHPDRFRRAVDPETLSRAEGAFARLAQAYETLSDTSARATYDLKLSSRPASPQQTPTPSATQSAANRPSTSSPASATGAANRAEESFQQGLAAMQKGDTAGSLAHFAEAARLAPQQARYHALYGRALMAEAHTRRQAEAELRNAVALDPNNASYRVTLAQLYVAVGLDHRAVEELERAVALDPRNAAARQMLERTKGK
ncbi:MAG: DnaJ domain-containing protein [Acidobacteriota bacterium]|nr:DnaJ domain-containing protein [Acidobacteriota bacterium]